MISVPPFMRTKYDSSGNNETWWFNLTYLSIISPDTIHGRKVKSIIRFPLLSVHITTEIRSDADSAPSHIELLAVKNETTIKYNEYVNQLIVTFSDAQNCLNTYDVSRWPRYLSKKTGIVRAITTIKKANTCGEWRRRDRWLTSTNYDY